MPDSQTPIVEILRGRVLRGLQAGTLGQGDRLPSARELVAEFGVDHRSILAAYRQLSTEGLVEIRERGGVYIAAAGARSGPSAVVPAGWFVDVLTEGYAREISGVDLAEWLRRSLETLRLRALVISSTDDQVAGLARELRDDFGLLAEGRTADALAREALTPGMLKQYDLFVATEAHLPLAEQLSISYGQPFVAIDVRPDLVVGEWAMLLRQPVWAIVATPEFGALLRGFFANVKGIENLRVLVHGRDDLSEIPEGAPVYVTHRVREALGSTAIRGNVLPPARTISPDSARRLYEFIVRANLRALEAMRNPPSAPPKNA